MANIVITDAKLTPNPVVAKGSFILSVGIRDIVYGLLTRSNELLTTVDGQVIEKIPRGE